MSDYRQFLESFNDSEYEKSILSKYYRGGYEDDEDSEDFESISYEFEEEHDKEDDKKFEKKADVKVEEEFYHTYSVARKHKYTEEELASIRKECEATIVHDYSADDYYHMSEEEISNIDMLKELNMQLGILRHTYSKVDQYVEAMRVVVKAWELLEKQNFLHTKDEFFSMVSEGIIVSGRFTMPKLRKMNQYNIDEIIKYISNPDLDPSELVPKELDYEGFYDEIDETDEESFDRLLDEDEKELILKCEEDPNNMPVIVYDEVPSKWIKGYDRNKYVSRKVKKKDRYSVEILHKVLNKIQSNPINFDNDDGYTRSHLLTNSMFEMDKPEKDPFDDFRYTGSWTDEDGIALYNIALREKLLLQHPPLDRYETYADKELNQFFRDLEKAGVNVINIRRKIDISTSDLESRKSKIDTKENKKMENAILQRLQALNGNAKFKKLVAKAEDQINRYYEQ